MGEETSISPPLRTAVMERSPLIGVIIVNYRTPALVARALSSLAEDFAAGRARAVVVDNASGDSSVDDLRRFVADKGLSDVVNVIASDRNGGFAAGNNIGLAALATPFVLFLNSDAVAAPGALAALEAAATSSGGDVFAPRLVGSGGAPEVSRFRDHSPLGEFIDGAQTGPITSLLKFAETPIFPDDRSATPQWASFAAIMISRAAIDTVGPMDDGFFLYYEDADYGRRLRRAGYRIRIVDDAVFVHDPGGSTKLREKSERLERLPAYYYRSRARYYRKYYGPAGLFLANIAWSAGRLAARCRGVFGRKAPAVNEGRLSDIWTTR